MNSQQLKEYFDKFVKNYKPYRGISEFSRIINVLIDNYSQQSYEKINSPFKTAFEEQIIPKEFYNNLLLSVGFPEELIAKFTENDKIVLLSSFMDFNRYKGTIKQFQKVSEKFNENLSIYELFIDYKTIYIHHYSLYLNINSNIIKLENEIVYDNLRIFDKLIIQEQEYKIVDKYENDDGYFVEVDSDYSGNETIISNIVLNRWVFIPEPIYKNTNTKLVTKLFPYQDIYNSTYHYFVNIEELESARLENNIILPIKSNLVFIDYNQYKEINVFHNLLFTIFLKEYNDSRLTIFFRDGDYSITLGRLYKLWYYILAKFYNYNFVEIDINNFVLFDKDYFEFDYTISDIQYLLDEYDSITTANQFSNFYYNYIESKLKIPNAQSRKMHISDFEYFIKNEVGVELIEYINNRINTADSEIKKYEYNFILDEILNSVITWVTLTDDENISNYYIYFTNNLTKISYSIDMSPSYNLINFLKPYHTEIISELSEYIKSDGSGNIVNTEILFDTYLKLTQASVYTISEYVLNTITASKLESITVNNAFISNLTYEYNLNDIIPQYINILKHNIHVITTMFLENNISVSSIQHFNNIELVLKSISAVIQNLNLNIIMKSINNTNISELIIDYIQYVTDTIISTNTYSTNNNILSILKHSVFVFQNTIQCIILKDKNTKTKLKINYLLEPTLTDEFLVNINDKITFTNMNLNFNTCINSITHNFTVEKILPPIIINMPLFIPQHIYYNSINYYNLFEYIIDHKYYNDIVINDDDSSGYIDSSVDLIVKTKTFNNLFEHMIGNKHNNNIIVNDKDTSGYVDSSIDLIIEVNKYKNLNISHVYNFV